METYRRHGALLIFVDYDDTVFDYRDSGDSHPRVLGLLRRAAAQGHLVSLFTAAVPARYPEMVDYMRIHGIPIASVNANPVALPFGNHGKPLYNLLLDDRAGLGQACEILERTLEQIAEIQRVATNSAGTFTT